MKQQSPVNLDLTKFKWPLAAITSILHRISGVLVFFGIALLLYFLDLSLQSEAGFQRVAELLSSPVLKLITWAVLSALLYHLVAGVKHLIMDFGIGETISGARAGAVTTLVLAAVAITIAGVWIW